MRSCVITGEKLPKKDLIRVVRTPEGTVVVDESGKVNGKGAYLKKDLETFIKKSKIPVRFYRTRKHLHHQIHPKTLVRDPNQCSHVCNDNASE